MTAVFIATLIRKCALGMSLGAALAVASPIFTSPASAQTQKEFEGAMKEAAKKANRDNESAQENQTQFDAPDWNAKGLPPVELFIAQPALATVVMSPDGKNIAAVRRDKGTTFLMLLNLDGGGSKAMPLPGMRIGEVVWGSNDRLIYIAGSENPTFQGTDRGIVMVGAPRMYSIGLDLKSPVMFFEKDKRLSRENLSSEILLTRIEGDPRHILMPLRMNFVLNLLKVDIYDGTWEMVGEGEDRTVRWFADRTGRPVIRFDAGNKRGTELNVMVRQGNGGGAKGNWKLAQTLRVDPEQRTSNSLDFNPIAPGPTPTQYYVTARAPGGGTMGVYLYDIEKAAMVQTLFAKDNADVNGAIIDPETGLYAGATYWEDRLKFEYVNPDLNKMMAGLDESFQHAWNIVPIARSRSADNKRWLIHVGNATNLGGYYIYDVDKKSAQEIGLNSPALQLVKPGQVLSIGYAARDGMKINGYLTMPSGWNDKAPKPPLIVMPHGGPEVRDTYQYSPIVQFLASRGYAVLQPNFRGSAGYGKAFQDAGRLHWGDAAQDDITDGVKFVVDKGFADPARMCIFGASYGGYAAMMSIVREPGLYKCAVSASGPTDLGKMLAWERKEEGATSSAYNYWTSQIGDPGKDKAMIEASSPALQADKVKVPVLLVHGKRDRTVPIEQSEFMLDALKKAGKTVDMSTYETAAHGMIGRDMKKFLLEIEAFFGKNLGAPGAAPASP
jgi:dipeptidyl aminopeptidase/acylaminoacyl peptidase